MRAYQVKAYLQILSVLSSVNYPKKAAIDQALLELSESKSKWLTTALTEKIDLLKQVLDGVQAGAQAQVADALIAKGLDPDSGLASEDWLGGPYANARIIGTLIETLESLEAHGHTGVTEKDAKILANGQVAINVLPKRLIDHILVNGFRVKFAYKNMLKQMSG